MQQKWRKKTKKEIAFAFVSSDSGQGSRFFAVAFWQEKLMRRTKENRNQCRSSLVSDGGAPGPHGAICGGRAKGASSPLEI